MAGDIDARKRSQWRARLQRYERSDQTVSEFCLDEGVSTASFYHWRKRLTEHKSNEAVGGKPAGFAEVRVIGSAVVTVRLAGGTRLEIPVGDVRVLQTIIDTLARVDAERAGESAC
jgi:hypothetical protein